MGTMKRCLPELLAHCRWERAVAILPLLGLAGCGKHDIQAASFCRIGVSSFRTMSAFFRHIRSERGLLIDISVLYVNSKSPLVEPSLQFLYQDHGAVFASGAAEG